MPGHTQPNKVLKGCNLGHRLHLSRLCARVINPFGHLGEGSDHDDNGPLSFTGTHGDKRH